MAKKKELTLKERDQVEALAAYLNQEQIADFLGIARKTFARMLKDDPTLFTQYKKGKARAIGKAAETVLTEIRKGNLTAAFFYLKTQAGWRENLDVTSGNQPIGAPKQINVVGRKAGSKTDRKNGDNEEDGKTPGAE